MKFWFLKHKSSSLQFIFTFENTDVFDIDSVICESCVASLSYNFQSQPSPILLVEVLLASYESGSSLKFFSSDCDCLFETVTLEIVDDLCDSSQARNFINALQVMDGHKTGRDDVPRIFVPQRMPIPT